MCHCIHQGYPTKYPLVTRRKLKKEELQVQTEKNRPQQEESSWLRSVENLGPKGAKGKVLKVKRN